MTSEDERLKAMRETLSSLQKEDESEQKTQASKDDDQENTRVGLRAGTELITPMIAGGLIGYWLDTQFDLKPLFLIAFLVLGVITGFVNVWRTTQNIGYKVGYKDQLIQDKKERDKRG